LTGWKIDIKDRAEYDYEAEEFKHDSGSISSCKQAATQRRIAKKKMPPSKCLRQRMLQLKLIGFET